eukprot:PITA_31233
MSCIVLGMVLTQEGAEGNDHPIAFASRRLSKAEKNYSTTEQEGHLYKTGNEEILRRYVLEFKRGKILAEAHGGFAGGHYVGRATTQKIICIGLWWQTLHKNSKAYNQACNVCQWTQKPSRRDEMQLNPKMTLQTFKKWEIDFLGPIAPHGKMGACYIITMTECLTQWAEAQSVKDSTNTIVVKFLFKNMLTWFGCPKILMSD